MEVGGWTIIFRWRWGGDGEGRESGWIEGGDDFGGGEAAPFSRRGRGGGGD